MMAINRTIQSLELIVEIDAMDLIGLDALPSSAPWRVKTRDLFLDARPRRSKQSRCEA